MATAAKKKKSVSAGGLLGQPILLLVEADAERRRQMARQLKKTSADILVKQASTVSSAIRQIDAHRPGTLLLDMAFPNGSGLEVLRHAMAVVPHCMAIVLTDRTDPASRLQCFEEGADFVFMKSDSFERVVDLAQRASKRETGRIPRKPTSRRVQTANLKLMNKTGLHALPAAHLVRLVQRFNAKLTITHNNRSADAKSIMSVLALGAEYGAEITFTAEGKDACQALAAIRSLVASKFHEPAPEKE